jgi:uncharacterized protein (DUF433 family)
MNGLAQQMAGPQQGMGQGRGQGMGQPTIEQVMQMLAQGASPEELVQMGVPPEMIQAAIEALIGQGQQQMAPEQEGLAGMHIRTDNI